MYLVGKCPPEADELAAAAERGFEAVELHLRPEHLADVAATAATVEASPVDAVSVHTLHARPEEPAPFRRSDRLARHLDATLVVHSQYAQHLHVDTLAGYGFESPHGYENNPGASVFHLRTCLLERGHDLVLDTAHLYTAEQDYRGALTDLLRTDADRIPLVHLADGTLTADGLAFGAGTLPLEPTVRALDAHHDGPVVVEVMPDDQAAARERALGWLD